MLAKGLLILLIFSKNQLFVSLILCIVFGLNLIDLGPDLYYFSPSAGFGFGLLLFI
jgi:hypothetical protein